MFTVPADQVIYSWVMGGCISEGVREVRDRAYAPQILGVHRTCSKRRHSRWHKANRLDIGKGGKNQVSINHSLLLRAV
jgi:hypothetical protein